MKYFIFTHVHYDIAYHGSDIIEINVSTDPAETVLSLSEFLCISLSFCELPYADFTVNQSRISLYPEAQQLDA